MGEGLASHLRKNFVCVAGSVEEARSLLILLITYISENTPSKLKTCVFNKLIYLETRALIGLQSTFFSVVQSCPWLPTGSNRLGAPYRTLKGVSIMLGDCVDVYKFGILIYEIGSAQI